MTAPRAVLAALALAACLALLASVLANALTT